MALRTPNIYTQLQNATDGLDATVCGWVKSKRVSKNFSFLVINDGSCQGDLQVIVDANTTAFAKLDQITTGTAVRVDGAFKESPGKGQKWEVHAADVEVCGGADVETYPLQKKGHSLEFLREISHLRSRTNTFGAVFRVRNVLSQLVHEYFQTQGFKWIHTPILTSSDCEGAGEMFQVTTMDLRSVPQAAGKVDYKNDFFSKPAFLTVSGQLEAEALALGLKDVYTFGPTFRAENSNTSRHLSEFWMVEPEMAFADLEDDMELAEGFLKHLFRGVIEKCPDELEFFEKHYKNVSIETLGNIVSSKFIRMTYTDAIEELLKSSKKFEFPVEWGADLQSEHERYLCEEVYKSPVILTDYPKRIKAFYMKLNDDEKTVRAMDVLVPRVGEIIGGSQREDRLDVLEARMSDSDVGAEDLWWYCELRKFGSAPHAGFGAGFERLVQFVTGMGNIRDVIPFPRTPGQISF